MAERVFILVIRDPFYPRRDGSICLDDSVDAKDVVELRDDVAGDTKQIGDLLCYLRAGYGKERPRG